MPIIRSYDNKIAKALQEKNALQKLRSYIHAAEPSLVYWLTNLWRNQEKAITYKEIREAILSGEMTLEQIQQWQHDYSVFVSETLLPAWLEAMDAAAEQITQMHPDFVFNKVSEEVRKWTEEHAAEMVTNCTNEQKAAINALIQKVATLEDMTVDELSRAIRPTIGLTKSQAVANMNYYTTLRANGLSHSAAMEKSLKYAERQHRYRAMVIARTELANAYNNGEYLAIKQAQGDGLMGTVKKRWLTAKDDRVCEYCRSVDDMQLDMDELFPIFGGKKTPTAHPCCRCSLVYDEIEPPQYKPEPIEPEEETIPEPPPPQVPDEYPMPKGLKYKGPAHLGGTGEMHIYKDIDGNEWLFKPAQSKAGKPEPFRAYVQEAAYKVQAIVDPETAVPVRTVTLDGRFGALQKRIDVEVDAINLRNWQVYGGELPRSVVSQLQREHITDWVLCNFDTHGGNFVFDKSGRLIGVDKEQAFRFINEQVAQHMTLTYHPNANVGEMEPIYNTLFKRFADGELDMNLQDSLPFIKRLEAISDAEYREIFRPYAEALKGKGKEAEELLDKIVERKQNLRETVRDFYSSLLTIRTGRKTTFVFADETPDHVKQPLAGVIFDKTALAKMSKDELKQIAKNKKIPYYANMSKEQLITAISDPAQAPVISAQVKEALDAARARRMGQKAETPKPQVTAAGKITSETLMEDLDIIPADKVIGVSVPSDGSSLEGMQLTAKRIMVGDQPGYEITGKMTYPRWQRFLDEKNIRYSKGNIEFRRSQIDWEKKTIKFTEDRSTQRVKTTVRKIQRGNVMIEVVDYNAEEEGRALMGNFTIRVTGETNGRSAAAKIKKALKDLRLDDLIEPVNEAAEKRLRGMRILWQRNPREAAALASKIDTMSDTEFENVLQRNGITKEKLKKLKWQEVFDSYSTYVDEDAIKEYTKAGAKYLWHGVGRDPYAIVNILKSPGLMSTTTRFSNGILKNGASSSDDIETGGADSVFTRLVTKKFAGKVKYDDSFMGTGYKVLIDPAELNRTDWYAYTGDEYGTTVAETFNYRLSSIDFVKEMNNSPGYHYNNEVMFRRGISKKSFIGIVAQDEYDRTRLIEELHKAGIHEVNGVKIEQFIKVSLKT